MDIDFKTISVVVGIASALLGLLYRVVPKRSDKIKKNLELLKLARETEANHLPLLRHVNSLIHEEYVHEELGSMQKAKIVFGYVVFAVTLTFAFLGLIGVVISWIAQSIFNLTDVQAGYILSAFVAFAVLTGIVGGSSEANKELEEVETNIKEKVRGVVEKDNKELKGDDEQAIIMDPTTVNKS